MVAFFKGVSGSSCGPREVEETSKARFLGTSKVISGVPEPIEVVVERKDVLEGTKGIPCDNFRGCFLPFRRFASLSGAGIPRRGFQILPY